MLPMGTCTSAVKVDHRTVDRPSVDGGALIVWVCDHRDFVWSLHVSDGFVYTGYHDGHARKIDASTGEVIWEHGDQLELFGRKMCVHSVFVHGGRRHGSVRSNAGAVVL